MNIVFWFGVAIAAVILWYLISKHFFRIGSNFTGMVDEVKNNIKKNEEDTENE